MLNKRSIRLVVGAVAGFTVWSLVAATPQGWGESLGPDHSSRVEKPVVTLVRVTAGKPSEFRFRLSNFAKLPAGTITFQVRNAGVLAHDFKLCTTPLAGVLPSSALKDRCFGKPTKILKPGETTTLTLLLGKSGLYEYRSEE